MKAIIEFNLPEDKDDYEMTVKSTDMFCMLWDIRQELLRPARKHGYSHHKLKELFEKNEEIISEWMWEVEEVFSEMLIERGIPGDI